MFMAKISIFVLLILIYIQGEMALTTEQLSVSSVSQEKGKRPWQFSVAYLEEETLFQY